MKAGKLLTLNDQAAYLPPARLWATPKASDAITGTTARQSDRAPEKTTHLTAQVHLFPTPTVHGDYNRKGSSAHSGDGLAVYVKNVKNLYPTPTVNDSKNNAPPSQHTENGRHSNPLNVLAGGALNPAWVEWLMGFPAGWTVPGGSMSLTFQK
jgi:hypothetical protein